LWFCIKKLFFGKVRNPSHRRSSSPPLLPQIEHKDWLESTSSGGIYSFIMRSMSSSTILLDVIVDVEDVVDDVEPFLWFNGLVEGLPLRPLFFCVDVAAKFRFSEVDIFLEKMKSKKRKRGWYYNEYKYARWSQDLFGLFFFC